MYTKTWPASDKEVQFISFYDISLFSFASVNGFEAICKMYAASMLDFGLSAYRPVSQSYAVDKSRKF